MWNVLNRLPCPQTCRFAIPLYEIKFSSIGIGRLVSNAVNTSKKVLHSKNEAEVLENLGSELFAAEEAGRQPTCSGARTP